MNLNRNFLIFVALTAAMTASCTRVPKPNLEALYRFEDNIAEKATNQFRQPPVVVIPGIVSSTLVDADGKEVWFGPWYKTLFSSYENMGLEIDPITLQPKPSTVRAGRLPKSIFWFDFYGTLFEALEDYGQYQETRVGTPYTTPERRYYKFAYDWRYDTVDTVAKLDEFIEAIRRDYNDPDLRVDFVTHSMGGLVARYYMRYGTTDVLDDNDFPVNQNGAKKVRRVIQLGPPNLGSVAAMHQMIKGYDVMLGTVPVEVLTTMPSVYQLLPHPLAKVLIDIDGEPLDWDWYDAELWQRLEWGVYDPEVIERIEKTIDDPTAASTYVLTLQRYFDKHIERARRFVWSLTVPVPDVEYEIVAFGGNCSPTPAKMLIENTDTKPVARLWPKEIKKKRKDVNYERIMLEPGDGRVTKPSVLARDFLDPTIARHKYSFFPLSHAFFLCHGHGQLAGNINFQDNLLNELFQVDLSRMQDMPSADAPSTLK